jgi:23S rRNA (guanosine2251-2'-O)-methyltransferase
LLKFKHAEGIPVEVVSSMRLEELSRSPEHQGLVARLGPYPYQTMDHFERMLAEAIARHAQARHSQASIAQPTSAVAPLVVICDRIQDSFNFGAILRGCDGASVAGVIVGDHSQAAVTPHVVRSSSGAVNYVPIIQTDDLTRSAQRIQALGVQLVAADSNARLCYWETKLDAVTALIIGSEAQGISPELLAISNHKVAIPMRGHVNSLNVAVAAGILLYEIRRQQSRL